MDKIKREYCYELDGFIDKYEKFLLDLKTKTEYIDPDGVDTISKICYYSDLTDFLNSREEWLKEKLNRKDKYIFLKPKNSLNSDKKSNAHESKIKVLLNNKELFLLTSDQFGFSAIENVYLKETRLRYPLPKLLENSNNEETRKFIAKYVYNSRSIGGAFVWAKDIPKEVESLKQYDYNCCRGGGVEDRVDLTLWEVKEFFEILRDKKTYAEVKLELKNRGRTLLNATNENEVMFEWLKHFETFEIFIDYLMLNPFVNDNYIPYDIITRKPLDYIENNVKLIDKYSESRGYICQNLDGYSIRKILEFIQEKIIKRGNLMIPEIEKYRMSKLNMK